jgi:hypothetical protein
MLRFPQFSGAKRWPLPKYSAPGDSLRSYTPIGPDSLPYGWQPSINDLS